MRLVDAIPPLKFPYFKFKPAVFNGFRLLSGPAMTDHQRRALLRHHEHQTRRCGCYRRHTPRTPLPRPTMATDLGPNLSAAAAPACMSADVGRRPCVVVGGLPLTNTHNALPRWCLCDQHHPRCVCEGAGRPWTWLCGRRAAAEARRPTEAHTREEGRTSRMTKISGLGCQQTPF